MKTSFINSKFHTMLATAIVTQAALMLLQISDTIIAGAMIGTEGFSAISLVTPIYVTVSFLSLMVVTGCATLYTRAVGAFDTDRANHLFSEGLIFIVFLCLLCLTCGFLLTDMYIDGYGVSDTIAGLAKDYCYFYRFVYFLAPLFALLSEIVYVEGDEHVSNICNILYFAGNIVVSVVACYFWGIKGIGFGSLVGLLLGIGILMTHFFKKTCRLHFIFYFRIKDLLSMMKYSFVDSSSCLYLAVTTVLMNMIILQRFGENYLPVYAAVLSLAELTIALDGIGIAMLPLLNVFRGERNGAAEKKFRKHALNTSVVAGVVYAALIVIFSPLLPKLFNVNDPEIYSLVVQAFRYIGIASVCISVIYFLTSYYLVSEHILLASLMLCMNSLLFPVGFGYLLSFPLGINGLWIAHIVSGIMTLVVVALYIVVRFGKLRIPFIYEPEMCDAEICNFNLTVPEIMEARDSIKQAMLNKGIPQQQYNLIMLLCEEVPQLILERNNGKALMIECTLLLRDNPELIFRDSGIVFDLTDEDLNITSLRSMVVSCLVTYVHDKENLVTTNYNRNVFRIRPVTSTNNEV